MTESLRILMLIELWFIIDTIVSAFEVLNYLTITSPYEVVFNRWRNKGIDKLHNLL